MCVCAFSMDGNRKTIRCLKLAYYCLPKLIFLFVIRHLPREVDPLVYNMSHEDPGEVKYSNIGGLAEQIRELREVRTADVIRQWSCF